MSDAVTHLGGVPAPPPQHPRADRPDRADRHARAGGAAVSRAAHRRRRLEEYRTGVTAARALLSTPAGAPAG